MAGRGGKGECCRNSVTYASLGRRHFFLSGCRISVGSHDPRVSFLLCSPAVGEEGSLTVTCLGSSLASQISFCKLRLKNNHLRAYPLPFSCAKTFEITSLGQGYRYLCCRPTGLGCRACFILYSLHFFGVYKDLKSLGTQNLSLRNTGAIRILAVWAGRAQ